MHPRRGQGKQDKRKKPRQTQTPERFKDHPLFGRIPLIQETIEHNGKMHIYYHYNLAYAPELPKDAVRGDPRKQNYCFHCHVPRYFYVNEGKTCVQCGVDFVFSAAEQKFWYESLGFYGESVPIRCPKCRRQQRSANVLSQQMAEAKKNLKRAPNDPSELLFLAETVVRYHQKTQGGKLAEAITAARKAYRVDSKAHEALFWEGAAHLAEHRTEKGLELMSRFVSQDMRSKKQHDLYKEAKDILDEGNA